MTEEQKKAAAFAAVEAYLEPLAKTPQIVLGIGSGSTIVPAVTRLVELIKEWNLNVVCIPTSFQAKQLITENNLVLGTLEQYPKLDLAIDGADECDSNLNCIKGGGGCLTQEKIVAYSAKTLVIVADCSKDQTILGTKWTKGVPIEVIPMAYKMVQNKLLELGSTAANLRQAKAKAGPCVTDNGCFIIDAVFPVDAMKEPEKLENSIIGIPGVVCTGLFVGMAAEAFFGKSSTEVVRRKRNN